MKHGPSQHQRTAGVPSLYFDLLADFFNRIDPTRTLAAKFYQAITCVNCIATLQK